MALLQIDRLHYGFNLNFSLALLESECVGLCGPSGSGKTLLLRAIADLDPSRGKLALNETLKNRYSPSAWRTSVAYLPSESAWWAEIVGEHFTNEDDSLFHQMGFNKDVRTWNISRLSSGEKQRLAFIRMLAQKPKVLLLDEPTANLDSKNKIRIEQIVSAYIAKHQAGCLWVSHDISQLERVAKRRVELTNGEWAEVV